MSDTLTDNAGVSVTRYTGPAGSRAMFQLDAFNGSLKVTIDELEELRKQLNSAPVRNQVKRDRERGA